MNPILEARHVTKEFKARGSRRKLRALEHVDLTLYPDEGVALVGETGSGKTTLGMILSQLVPQSDGDVLYCGQPVATLSDRERKNFRRKVQVVFQDPRASLNPRKLVGKILLDALRDGAQDASDAAVATLLNTVGLDERFAFRLPHQLSGGQQQRVGIARALAPKPDVLIADEPVSALDVSVQAQIVNLLQHLQKSLHLTLLVIAHDLAVVQRLCRRVAVMYFGHVVEIGSVADVYRQPYHPYTKALLASVPRISSGSVVTKTVLAGEPPDPHDRPSGCIFQARCPERLDKCLHVPPAEIEVGATHAVECHLYERTLHDHSCAR